MSNVTTPVNVPNDWQLVSSGVLAPNKNDPSYRYFGELFDTPNGFMHMISIYRKSEGGDISFTGSKAHLLKQDSTVLYNDPNVSYVRHGDPVEAIRKHEASLQ